MKVPLVCPKDKTVLKIVAGNYFCSDCKRKYKISNGIPSFIIPNESIRELDEDDLVEIRKMVQKNGWHDTIENHIHDNFPELYRYITEPSRSSLIYLLSPKKFENALDLGCGYGTISLALAEFFKNVVSEEMSLEKLSILKERAKEDKKNNITLINADAMGLPLKNSFFDAITIIGVLEYIGLVKPDLPVEENWKVFLKIVYDLLHDGGQVIIGIENRIGFQYFLGWKDHNDLRGTTLMPRILANFYSKIKVGEKYKIYTYSYAGYKKLLKEAGFKKIEFFSPLKSYRFPKYIIPLDHGKAPWNYFLKNVFIPKNRKEELLVKAASRLPISVIKKFSPHFIIKAQK